MGSEDGATGNRWWIGGLLGVTVFILVDVWVDWGEGAHPAHMALEALATLILGGIAVAMFRRREVRIDLLHEDLRRTKTEAERWRGEAQQALAGLGVAIDRQFERWALTPAEREVALLLLKGLSLKEVADVRQTSERTARDQARSVYRKAGIPGRSALAAFFLEDLLLPVRESTEP